MFQRRRNRAEATGALTPAMLKLRGRKYLLYLVGTNLPPLPRTTSRLSPPGFELTLPRNVDFVPTYATTMFDMSLLGRLL